MLTFSGRTANDKLAATYLIDQFRETFNECDLSADKTGLLSSVEFRNFLYQIQADFQERNVLIPMPNYE